METEKTLKNGQRFKKNIYIAIDGRLIRTTKGNHKDHKSNFFVNIVFPCASSTFSIHLLPFKSSKNTELLRKGVTMFQEMLCDGIRKPDVKTKESNISNHQNQDFDWLILIDPDFGLSGPSVAACYVGLSDRLHMLSLILIKINNYNMNGNNYNYIFTGKRVQVKSTQNPSSQHLHSLNSTRLLPAVLLP